MKYFVQFIVYDVQYLHLSMGVGYAIHVNLRTVEIVAAAGELQSIALILFLLEIIGAM